ncbi:MAG: hypothetical protein AB7N80_12115 [Bdellovibrionales bacterium]
MFKQVIAIVAAVGMIATVNANAQGAAKGAAKAAEEVGAAVRGGKTIKPGQAGAKVNSTGAVKSTSSEAAGVVTQKQEAAAATGVDSHVTCPADSVLSKLPRSAQATVQEFQGMGGGGSACMVNLKSVEAANAKVAGDAEAIQVAKRLGVTDIARATKVQLVKIAQGWTKGIMNALGIKEIAEGVRRTKAICANNCDLLSKQLCGAIQ